MSDTVMNTEQELFLVDRVGMQIIGGGLASLLNMGIKGYGQTVEQVYVWPVQLMRLCFPFT